AVAVQAVLGGYRDALAPEAADPRLIADGGFTAQGGERAMAELLAAAPDLDGVFVCSDLMASGALRTLRAHGRRVPEAVGVGGCAGRGGAGGHGVEAGGAGGGVRRRPGAGAGPSTAGTSG
ncbi:substrate-binding domain-containing protein, partial [Streptomyces sp. WAC 06725]|uniref:substrate-binding domain-containing protein n=1 Tax=Streptomyces sp. WAC 06725 TaxID=2203209 RepID=UPI0021ADE610